MWQEYKESPMTGYCKTCAGAVHANFSALPNLRQRSRNRRRQAVIDDWEGESLNI
jgi:ferredoxin